MLAPFLPTITCPVDDEIHKLKLTDEGWRILLEVLRFYARTQITGVGDGVQKTYDQIRVTCLAQLLDVLFPWPDCRLWENEITRCFEGWPDCADARDARTSRLARVAALPTKPSRHRLGLHVRHFHLGDRQKQAA